MYCGGKHTHELFRRACSSSHDQINYLLSLWEDYERAQGSLETWNDYLRRSDHYRQIALQREETQQKRSAPSAPSAPSAQTVQIDESAQTAQSSSVNAMVSQEGGEGGGVPAEKRVKMSSTQRKKEVQRKMNDVETQRRTVFVNNLSFGVNEDTLQSLFAEYGTVVDVYIARNSHGKSRGYAYIEFTEESAAALAIEQDKKELDGRKLEVKLSIPKQDRIAEKKEKPKQMQSTTIPTTIYVTNMPIGVSEYEFSVFFSKVRICNNLKSEV